MALVLTAAAPQTAAGPYLRIDGIRFNPAARRRKDGIWTVDPATPVLFHVYTYRSTASRRAGDAPLTDEAFATTLADLALIEMVAGSACLSLGPAWTVPAIDTPILWRTLYRHLASRYPGSVREDKQIYSQGL